MWSYKIKRKEGQGEKCKIKKCRKGARVESGEERVKGKRKGTEGDRRKG